jgi:cysteine desulfurase
MGPSHVLLALGMTPEEAGECIRFSVGRFSTFEELEFAVDRISSSLGRLTPAGSRALPLDA